MTARESHDLFLSHAVVDKGLVRRLIQDLQREAGPGRPVSVWLDESEIQAGDSIPRLISRGLEHSRFIGLVMTPAYFESRSGWTDAEWHSAIHADPDNRAGRLLPLLFADCPYIPFLLRQLRWIDFRGDLYHRGVAELITALVGRQPSEQRQQAEPRPFADLGGTTQGLFREAPDFIQETLSSNLFPIDRLPQFVYRANIASRFAKRRLDGSIVLPTKEDLRIAIRDLHDRLPGHRRYMPAFRIHQQTIVTFHNAELPEEPISRIVDHASVKKVLTTDLVVDETGRNIVTSLLNMARDRHGLRLGLALDSENPGRFYFPPKDGGPHVIRWTPFRKPASRSVAKPYQRDGVILFWRHQGAYLRIFRLDRRFFLQINPTWVITEDGVRVRRGRGVGSVVAHWTGPERNLHVLYHVRFWSWVLGRGREIRLVAGDDHIDISRDSAWIQQHYGIASDQKDLLPLLDREAALLASREERLAELLIESDVPTIAEGGTLSDADDAVREEEKNE